MSLSIINDAYDAAYSLQATDPATLSEVAFRRQVASILFGLAQIAAGRPSTITAAPTASAAVVTGAAQSNNTGVPHAPDTGATVTYTGP